MLDECYLYAFLDAKTLEALISRTGNFYMSVYEFEFLIKEEESNVSKPVASGHINLASLCIASQRHASLDVLMKRFPRILSHIDALGRNAFMHAVIKHDLKSVEIMQKYQLQPYVSHMNDIYDVNAMEYAIAQDDLEIVLFLLEKNVFSPRSYTPGGFIPFHYACQNGTLRMIKAMLLEFGYNQSSILAYNHLTSFHLLLRNPNINVEMLSFLYSVNPDLLHYPDSMERKIIDYDLSSLPSDSVAYIKSLFAPKFAPKTTEFKDDDWIPSHIRDFGKKRSGPAKSKKKQKRDRAQSFKNESVQDDLTVHSIEVEENEAVDNNANCDMVVQEVPGKIETLVENDVRDSVVSGASADKSTIRTDQSNEENDPDRLKTRAAAKIAQLPALVATGKSSRKKRPAKKAATKAKTESVKPAPVESVSIPDDDSGSEWIAVGRKKSKEKDRKIEKKKNVPSSAKAAVVPSEKIAVPVNREHVEQAPKVLVLSESIVQESKVPQVKSSKAVVLSESIMHESKVPILNGPLVESRIESAFESSIESLVESAFESSVESPVESAFESPVESDHSIQFDEMALYQILEACSTQDPLNKLLEYYASLSNATLMEEFAASLHWHAISFTGHAASCVNFMISDMMMSVEESEFAILSETLWERLSAAAAPSMVSGIALERGQILANLVLWMHLANQGIFHQQEVLDELHGHHYQMMSLESEKAHLVTSLLQ